MANTVQSKLVLEAWQPWKGEIRIHRGGTYDPSMDWTDDDGEPIDWTGYTGRIVITLNLDEDGNEVTPTEIELTTENGGIVMDANGRIQLIIDSAVTSTIVECGGSFRFYLVEPDADVRLFGYGGAKVV